MTATTALPTTDVQASREQPRFRRGFGSILLTVVHLAALGVLGSIALAVTMTLLGAGLGLVLLMGLGILLLIALVYTLFGIGWFETERVRGLYGFAVPPLAALPMVRPGFAGWLRTIVKQSIDARMWLAVLSFSIGSFFGVVVLSLAQTAAWNLAIMVGGSASGAALGPLRLLGLGGIGSSLMLPSLNSPWWSLAAALLALMAIIGLAALHAVIVRGLLGPSSRGALAAELRTRSAQRVGAVRAAEVERTRIERDLHDGVQPRLVSIGMTLGLAQQKIDEDPAAAKALVAEAHTSTKAAITELRQLARGIHASVLDDRGLDAALSALAGRSHIPVVLDVQMAGAAGLRQGSAAFRDAEAAVYFSIAEALTNAAKHSRAAECRVTVRLREPHTSRAVLWARVEDNGIGGATVQPGGGLDGLSNRVLAAGGALRLDSPPAGPTTVEVSVPCAS